MRLLPAIVLCTLVTVGGAQAQPNLQASASSVAAHAAADLRERLRHEPPAGLYRDAAGVLWAEGPRWRSEFTAAGVCVRTRSAADSGTEVGLHLEFLGHHRTGSHAPAAPAEPTVADVRDGAVGYARGPVTERYRVEGQGIEQSFHFAVRPAGTGDLVLSIGLHGDVTAPAAAACQQELLFAHAGAPTIRYGAAIAFDARGNRTPVRTAYDGRSTISLVVPEAFVEAASYPLVVDPTIGPVLSVSGTATDDFEPDVAFDPINRRFFVVWRHIFSATSIGLRGAVYDASGALVTPTTPIANGPALAWPAVAFCHATTNPGFFVVWQDGTRISGQLFTALGLQAAAPIAITTPTSNEVHQRPSVSGPGYGAVVVAWDRTLTTVNGSMIRSKELYWPVPGSPSVVDVGPDRLIFSAGALQRHVKLAASDVRILSGGADWFANRMVWEIFVPTTGQSYVYTCSFRVRPSSFAFAFIQTPTAVIGANTSGADSGGRIAAVASRHSYPTDLRYCITWQQFEDVYAAIYDLGGVVGLAPIPVRATLANEGAPAVAAGTCDFSIAYTETNAADVDLYAARITADGIVTANHVLIDAAGSYYQDSVAIASRPIRDFGTQDNVSMVVWSSYSGAGGRPIVKSRLFVPVATSENPFGVGCPGPGGAVPTIGTVSGPPLPGNASFGIALSQAPPSSLAVLVVSSVTANNPLPGAPGCRLYLDQPFVALLPAATTIAGAAVVSLPIPCAVYGSPGLACQWAIYTPGHNAFGWITSDDVDLLWTQ